MPQTAEAKAATEARAKESEEARAAYDAQVKAEEEAAEKAAESGESKFIVSVSGMATEEDALDAFDGFVNEFDTVSGSIVVGGISHDVSEFKPEEEDEAESSAKSLAGPAEGTTTKSSTPEAKTTEAKK